MAAGDFALAGAFAGVDFAAGGVAGFAGALADRLNGFAVGLADGFDVAVGATALAVGFGFVVGVFDVRKKGRFHNWYHSLLEDRRC